MLCDLKINAVDVPTNLAEEKVIDISRKITTHIGQYSKEKY